jgi:Questin oxidase-like
MNIVGIEARDPTYAHHSTPDAASAIVRVMTTTDSTALRTQLLQAARWDAEYGASLSNHLPMALIALVRLGASDERLAEFAKRYTKKLHAAPPTEPWPAGEAWRALLGQPRAWPAYRTLWREWIRNESAPEVLAQALPTLMQGAGAAAFHGLIRAAYALDANHADELADALAYWSCRWFACGAADGEGSNADTAAVLKTLDFAAELHDEPLIAQQMARAATDPRFAPALARWRVDAHITLPRLAMLAAERYAARAEFTVLHLVTSAHAVRVLLPWLPAEERLAALRHYAGAAAAAWATLPHDHKGAPLQVTMLPWTEIAARAVDSDDDHLIKLVDSCRELEKTLGGAVWSRAASRAVAKVA